jgi:hypothetical protein
MGHKQQNSCILPICKHVFRVLSLPFSYLTPSHYWTRERERERFGGTWKIKLARRRRFGERRIGWKCWGGQVDGAGARRTMAAVGRECSSPGKSQPRTTPASSLALVRRAQLTMKLATMALRPKMLRAISSAGKTPCCHMRHGCQGAMPRGWIERDLTDLMSFVPPIHFSLWEIKTGRGRS